MVGKSKTANKKEKRRMQLLPQVGCICCRAYGIETDQIQVHHIVQGGRRLGHEYTLPLCYWHHEGVPPEGLTRKEAESRVGPSLKSKKRFNEVFGSELELLEYVNKALEIIEESIY